MSTEPTDLREGARVSAPRSASQTSDGVAVAGEPAVADRVADAIKRRIVTGDLPIGSRLRQEELANEYGVSRMPIREALRKLEASGILEVFPRRGAFVRGPTGQEIREAYVVRAELEALAAELATVYITDSEIQRLREAAELFRTSVLEFTSLDDGVRAASLQGATWPDANDMFHETILVASGNSQLQRSVQQLHGVFPRNLTWAALSRSSALLRRNVEEHQAILTAIDAGDEMAAREATKHHVLSAGDLVASRFERDGQQAAQGPST